MIVNHFSILPRPFLYQTSYYCNFNHFREWFFDELKGEQTEGTTLDPPLPSSPLPVASSSTNDHGSTNQSHSQIQQQMPQTTHQSNAYQEQQMGHRDVMMPSTSTYGMQQHQPSVLQEQQQVPVSQHQMQQQVHSQQQFETLQPYNPNQQNQNIQDHYQPMVFPMEMDYMSNEASTSSAMPVECGISQEYNQAHQYQQSQQQQQNDNQWMQMEQSSQMAQQHAQHMTSVVYTSTSQQMPRIPDPGGHHINQPQMINSYNPQQNQQILQAGINGETILTNMQPVQQIQRIIPQPLQQQQQFDLNSNNYVQQPITYINGQQFIASQPGEPGNVSFHQPLMQVIPQIVPMQPPAEAPGPPVSSAKPKTTKNTSKANNRKKNQPPPQQPQAPAEGDSILSKIGAFGSVAVNFNAEKAEKMNELMGMIAALQASVSLSLFRSDKFFCYFQDAQGYDAEAAKSNLEKQLEELLTG